MAWLTEIRDTWGNHAIYYLNWDTFKSKWATQDIWTIKGYKNRNGIRFPGLWLRVNIKISVMDTQFEGLCDIQDR